MTVLSPLSWEQVATRRLIDVAKSFYPEVEGYKARLLKFPQQESFVRRSLIWKLKKLEIDPADPFIPSPPRSVLEVDGIHIGAVSGGGEFFLSDADFTNGALFIGSPKSGKSASAMHLVLRAHERGIGTLWVELRVDALVLASVIPDALVVPIRKLRINLFQPPRGVPLKTWMPVIAARLTLDLGLQLASESFFIRMCERLIEVAERRQVLPTLLDFLHVLETEKTKPRSSDESSQDRIKARLATLLQLCGPEMFAVQRGHPVIEAAEAGRVVIIDMRIDRIAADLITSVLFYSLAHSRLDSRDPFHHAPVIVGFDEERSLLHQRDLAAGIPDIDLLFSRARALNIRPVVLEQIPSQLSRAVLTNPRCRLLFSTSEPEAFTAARILGLNPAQAAEIAKLRQGECIVSLLGEKTPNPFKVQVPFDPARANASTNRDDYEDAVRRSLEELDRAVVPWVPLFSATPDTTAVSRPSSNRPRQQDGPDLSEDAWQVFFRIVHFPEEFIEERTGAIRFERGREGRARGQLKTLGLIARVGKVGKWEFFGPTDKGKQLATQRGASIDKFKSYLLHEIVLRRSARKFARAVQGLKLSRSGPIRDRQPDGLASFPDGRRVVLQVSDTNSAANEVDAAMDMVGESLLERVVLVACEKAKARAVAREIEARVEASSDKKLAGELAAKIVVWDAATVFADAFDWTTFASGPRPAAAGARGPEDSEQSGEGDEEQEARDAARA